jgi:ParB family chromosome partitioning protein
MDTDTLNTLAATPYLMFATNQVTMIPLALIYGNPEQPRKIFAAGPLEELAASISRSGLLQPISVVPKQCEYGSFMIVAGERRWKAAQLAKLTEIKAIVCGDLTAREVHELALVENLLRQDLQLMEEAKAYQGFLDRGYTVDSLAKLLGMKQPWRITERADLLKLDAKFQDALTKGMLQPSQAYEMTRLSTEGQFQLWRAIQDGKCESFQKLRRLAGAIYDQEHQAALFQNESEVTEKDRKTLDTVEQFINLSGKLLGLITDDDLSILERVVKSNAQACADKLELLEKLFHKTRVAMLTNVAKQQVLATERTPTQ